MSKDVTVYADDKKMNDGIIAPTSRKTVVNLVDELIIGDLSILVLKYGTHIPCPSLRCTINGYEKSFSLVTDAYGHLLKRKVPAGAYVLTVENLDYAIHTVSDDDPPIQIWVVLPEEAPAEMEEEDYDELIERVSEEEEELKEDDSDDEAKS